MVFLKGIKDLSLINTNHMTFNQMHRDCKAAVMQSAIRVSSPRHCNTKPWSASRTKFPSGTVLFEKRCKSLVHKSSCAQVTAASSALHGWQHVFKVRVISCISRAQMYGHDVLQQVFAFL